jgi:glycosyltransferase involved in cell wall biosynthesis
MKNERIKVAMYSPHFLPLRGGAEIATCKLAQALSDLVTVDVYTFNWAPTIKRKERYGLRFSSSLVENESVNGIHVHRFPIMNLPLFSSFSVELVVSMRAFDADIVHFQGSSRLFSRYLIQSAVRGQIKVLTTHGLHESVDILSTQGNFLFLPIFARSFKGMDHIIALSRRDRELLLQLGVSGDKITVIPNGIDTKKFQNRGRFVERNDKLKILCVARFAKNKNYELLIHALSKLRKQSDFDAYFIGDFDSQEYFARIVRLIKSEKLEGTVRIGLAVSDAELVDCYLSCDMFVLPSNMETFPLVILEAMYAGLPIIATRVGGIPEVVHEGVNGFLVSPGDSEELCQKCLCLLSDSQKRNEIRLNNIKVASKFSWDEVAQSTFNLYEKLLREH